MAVHWLRHYASIAGGACVQALGGGTKIPQALGCGKKKKRNSTV